MKKVIALLTLLVLVFTMAACSAEEPVKVGGSTTKNEKGDPIFQVGDTAELEDVHITLVSVTESTGAEYFEPTEGNIFVLFEFTIENKSDEALNVSSMMSFSAYCDDYSCEYSLSAQMAAEDKTQLDGTVAAGKKMTGVIGYEVAADWQEMEVHYQPDIMSDTKIVFVAQQSE